MTTEIVGFTPKPDGLRQGGLMRCCIATIEDLYPDGPANVGVEGQTMQCKYHEDDIPGIRFRDCAWEWNHD
jgi:hypothetical protein